MTGTNGVVAAAREVAVPCICPGRGHGAEGDTITLRETLDFTAIRAVRWAWAMAREQDPEAGISTLMAVMSESFVVHGVESWTLRDEKGTPIEVTPTNIRRYILDDVVTGQVVADAADLVYQSLVLAPLAVLAGLSSPPSPTDESTSAASESSSTSPTTTDGLSDAPSTRSGKHQKRSKRSSTTSTPTASTGPTSSASAGGSTS